VSHFPATVDIAGIVTPNDKDGMDNSRKDFLETVIQSTPNSVIKIHGDGGATARGLIFSVSRNMLRLRASFKVDAGNNYSIRVRLMKYHAADGLLYELAVVQMSNTVDGNPGSNTYHIRQQLVSAGANPSKSGILANSDALYFVIDKPGDTVAVGVSQIVVSAEHEVL
jgi:hypothetical protein